MTTRSRSHDQAYPLLAEDGGLTIDEMVYAIAASPADNLHGGL